MLILAKAEFLLGVPGIDQGLTRLLSWASSSFGNYGEVTCGAGGIKPLRTESVRVSVVWCHKDIHSGPYGIPCDAGAKPGINCQKPLHPLRSHVASQGNCAASVFYD